MKTLIKFLLAMSICFSTQSFAFDSNDSLDTVKEKLTQLDCSKDVDDCRYYSAIEYLAFAKACPIAYNERKNSQQALEEDTQQISDMIDKWTAIQDPKIRKAVFAKSNPFREEMQEMTLEYLHAIPIGELAIECTRIQFIMENKNPEELSEVLRLTKNYQ